MVLSWFQRGKDDDITASPSSSSQSSNETSEGGGNRENRPPSSITLRQDVVAKAQQHNEHPTTPQDSSWRDDLPKIHPSLILAGFSIPMFWRAHRLYHQPMTTLLQKATKQKQISLAELQDAEIGVRRAVGFAVAGRALRLGTLLSFGSFGMCGAVLFFVCDWRTLQEGMTATREWGYTKRKKLDQLLGVKERVDEDHPEVIARQQMTLDEERRYLANKYWFAKEPTASDNSESISVNDSDGGSDSHGNAETKVVRTESATSTGSNETEKK